MSDSLCGKTEYYGNYLSDYKNSVDSKRVSGYNSNKVICLL